MTTEDKTKAVTKKGDAALPVLALYERNMEQVQEFLDDGGIVFSDLPQIKIPPGGGKNWELPDGTAAQTFRAVVLMQHETRAYWKGSGDGNVPPDCSSSDAKIGHGDNGSGAGDHACDSCRWSQFDTATNEKGEPTAGQACKFVTNMVVLTESAGRLPAIVALPPTSAIAARTFRNDVFRSDRRRHEVLAEFTLTQKQGAFKYSVADIKVVGPLSEDDIVRVQQVSEMFLPAITRMFESRQRSGASDSST